MKKIFLTILILVCFCVTVEAKTYVLRDQLTGEPQGAASISDKAINDWAINYILEIPDNPEDFRGKRGYEMKFENGKTRLATQSEIDTYLAQQEQEQQNAVNAKKKQEFLDWLEDEDIKTKIKDIKNL